MRMETIETRLEKPPKNRQLIDFVQMNHLTPLENFIQLKSIQKFKSKKETWFSGFFMSSFLELDRLNPFSLFPVSNLMTPDWINFFAASLASICLPVTFELFGALIQTDYKFNNAKKGIKSIYFFSNWLCWMQRLVAFLVELLSSSSFRHTTFFSFSFWLFF